VLTVLNASTNLVSQFYKERRVNWVRLVGSRALHGRGSVRGKWGQTKLTFVSVECVFFGVGAQYSRSTVNLHEWL
jgi:hypothetical protein